MNQYSFSPSQLMLYHAIDFVGAPPDRVIITQEIFESIEAETLANADLSADANGFPVVTPWPDPHFINIGRIKIAEVLALYLPRTVSESESLQYKYQQAVIYKNAGYPMPLAPEHELFLKEEAAIDNITPRDLANFIIAERIIMNSIASKAEAMRAKLKHVIASAPKATQKRAAIDAVVAELQDFINSIGAVPYT